MFTFFSRQAQAEKWTKTKGFQLSCKFNIFGETNLFIFFKDLFKVSELHYFVKIIITIVQFILYEQLPESLF